MPKTQNTYPLVVMTPKHPISFDEVQVCHDLGTGQISMVGPLAMAINDVGLSGGIYYMSQEGLYALAIAVEPSCRFWWVFRDLAQPERGESKCLSFLRPSDNATLMSCATYAANHITAMLMEEERYPGQFGVICDDPVVWQAHILMTSLSNLDVVDICLPDIDVVYPEEPEDGPPQLDFVGFRLSFYDESMLLITPDGAVERGSNLEVLSLLSGKGDDDVKKQARRNHDMMTLWADMIGVA